VAQLVLRHSECAEVFVRYRIDFCCKGHVSIAEAAAARGVALSDLARDLATAVEQRRAGPLVDLGALPTARLVAHIISKHHEYLWQTLPFVTELAAKVGRVHGDHNPKLLELSAAVSELRADLLAHLKHEEDVLFPALLSQADAGRRATLLGSMLTEHDSVARLLERIRESSDDFTFPEWACNSYRTLIAELDGLRRDIFQHVHLENHALAPRFTSFAPTEQN
jgi:regulator of cell morphogenesis and NO signaling